MVLQPDGFGSEKTKRIGYAPAGWFPFDLLWWLDSFLEDGELESWELALKWIKWREVRLMSPQERERESWDLAFEDGGDGQMLW